MSTLPEILKACAIQDLENGDNISDMILTVIVRYNGTKYTFKMDATPEAISARVDLLKKQIRKVGNGESGAAQDARRAQRQISTRQPTEKCLLKIQEEFAQSGDLFSL